MFNIPTNVRSAISLDDNNSNTNSAMQNQFQQPPVQNQFQQPPMQNQFQQPPMQNQFQQPPMQGGGVSLRKGQKTNLSKMNPNLDEIDVCLGWDVGSNQNYDLDSEAFLLGANDQVIGDSWFVFYNQPMSPDGSVKHTGDNKTGQGDGDDEIIHIKLSQVNPQVEKIIFVVTINDAKTYGYHFGNIQNAFIRVVDRMTNRELVHFQLSEYYKEVISMMVGELYKKDGDWRFNPIGSGTGDDLEGLCRRYGVHLI